MPRPRRVEPSPCPNNPQPHYHPRDSNGHSRGCPWRHGQIRRGRRCPTEYTPPHVRAVSRNRRARFVGVDGEGGDDPDGIHRLYMLTVEDRTLYTGRPLATEEILHWLVRQPKEPLYVGYSFTYDTVMILADLPRKKWARLARPGSRKGRKGNPLPIDWGPWRLDYMPRQFLWITHKPSGRTFRVYDLFKFFQGRFTLALESADIGTPDQRRMVEAGKARRGGPWADVDVEAERTYNQLECDLLADLAEWLRDACQEADLIPSQWRGPGWLASKLLRQHSIDDYRGPRIVTDTPAGDAPPPPAADLDRAVLGAYFGGRFETTGVGWVGDAHEYDIASAYPHALTTLPCLAHGTWSRHVDDPRSWSDPPAWWVGYCRWDYTGRQWAPTLWRDPSGRVHTPLVGQGWRWSVEVAPDVEVSAAWVWRQECGHRPFRFVDDLYHRRAVAKAAGNAGEAQVLKLAYNSLYGKLAQSVGRQTWTSWCWAGMVTATTRGRVTAAALAHPDRVVMIATDGIVTTGPLKLETSDRLGGWEHSRLGRLFVCMPGLYWQEGAVGKLRSRGISAGLIAEHASRIESWHRMGRREYQLTQTLFRGPRWCDHLDRWHDLGQWVQSSRTIDLLGGGKRNPPQGRRRGVSWWPLPPKRLTSHQELQAGAGMGVASWCYQPEVPSWLAGEVAKRADQPDGEPSVAAITRLD